MTDLSNNPAIGIDLGATNVRVGLVDEGKIKKIDEQSLSKSKTPEAVVKQMTEMIQDVDPQHEATQIGIGVPSVVDSKNGYVYDVQNIPGWEKVPLSNMLSTSTGKEVIINNDANCFALGESKFGKNQSDHLIGLIIGTGFAGGIIIEGEIYTGRNFGAGEFGMIPYKSSILEHYCSGQFFEKLTGKKGEDIYSKAVSGDMDAIRVFDEFGGHVAEAVKIVLYSYDPEVIVFGGSVSKSFSLFENGFNRHLQTFGYPGSLKNLRISISTKDHIAVLGAAALCYQN